MTLIDGDQQNVKESSNNTARSDKSSKTTTENLNTTEASKWGYDLYPERRSKAKTSITDIITGNGRSTEKVKCERAVYRCWKESPLVKLMVGAMKSAGCPIDIRRHVSCEECAPQVSGGFDPILNQVVICQNNAVDAGMVQGILTHEMIHMFDYCKNNLDFKNIDHLACTEIRAANLAHCSFLSAWLNGDTSFFNFKNTHQNCVKSKALSSIVAARNISKTEAIDAIERVFDKCYNDLEPIGRRIRRNSLDMHRAYDEGYYYGYDDTN